MHQAKEILKKLMLINPKTLLFQNCIIKWNIALPVQFMPGLSELEAVKTEKSELHQRDLDQNKSQKLLLVLLVLLLTQEKLRRDKTYHFKAN